MKVYKGSLQKVHNELSMNVCKPYFVKIEHQLKFLQYALYISATQNKIINKVQFELIFKFFLKWNLALGLSYALWQGGPWVKSQS